MISLFDVLNLNTTWWDIVEFKLVVVFFTVMLAVWLTNKLYEKQKNKNKDQDQ